MENIDLVLLIIEIIYFILVAITMILFRKEILVISNVRERYQNFYEKHKIWFHILYSLGWPIPWISATFNLIKNKLKSK